jgi:hypothetical protein
MIQANRDEYIGDDIDNEHGIDGIMNNHNRT